MIVHEATNRHEEDIMLEFLFRHLPNRFVGVPPEQAMDDVNIQDRQRLTYQRFLEWVGI